LILITACWYHTEEIGLKFSPKNTFCHSVWNGIMVFLIPLTSVVW